MMTTPDKAVRFSGLLSAVFESDNLLMSRKNCHAKNVTSIVTGVNGGCLIRAFVAWPGHDLKTNKLGDVFAVGIHDHRYAIELKAIFGTVLNTTYELSVGAGFHRWRFRSGLASGTPSVEFAGLTDVRQVSSQVLSDKWLRLEANELHGIACDGPSAWWVREGNVEKAETTLLTVSDCVATGGLYDQFKSRQEVVEHVLEFVECCG